MRSYADRNGPATRQEIVNALRLEPGLTKSQLCRFLDLSWGTISHHVRLLQAEGSLLRRALFGRGRLFLPATSDETLTVSHLVRDPVLPNLLQSVGENPGIGIQALAKTLALDRRIVRRHLDRLIKSGLVAQTRDYRPKFFVIEQQRANSIVFQAGRRKTK